ncbi:MAG: FIST C-terminal domain-containing protein [Treponema sp.]|nr:FIST C-terminal domain-containing protein [Treponema sp.]
MIKFITAHSSETDDVEAAVSEILSQLDPGSLLKFSAGIMYYHADYAKTGITKRICDSLPFPIIGSTTSSSAVRGSGEGAILTINVFTSDTIAFNAGICDPVTDEPFMPMEKLYNQLLNEKPPAMGKKPAMFFVIAPDFYDITGDDYLAALTGLSGGVPVFGSAAFTHTSEFRDIKTFFNGAEYDSSMAVLAFWGNLEPKFFRTAIPEAQVINQRAVITDSYRNRIRKINGIPVLEYFESVGLVKNGSLEGIDAFPLILHVQDGSRLIRTIHGLENGEILCSGMVPSHLPVEISSCDRGFITESARKTVDECKKWLESQNNTGSHAALVVSCIARRWILGTDVFAEINKIDSGLKELPYHFVYSRGEYCPAHVQDNRTVNYFFNFTMGICII